MGGLGGIDQADFDTQTLQRGGYAVGIAENELADDQVIAGAQQGHENRGDCRHAGGKAHRGAAALHAIDNAFQRGNGRRRLARVDIAGHRALENVDDFLGCSVAVLHRGVDRLVNGAMFNVATAVAMDSVGGETPARGSVGCAHSNCGEGVNGCAIFYGAGAVPPAPTFRYSRGPQPCHAEKAR